MIVGVDEKQQYQQIEYRVEQFQQLHTVLTHIYPYLLVKDIYTPISPQGTVKVTKLSKAEIIELTVTGEVFAQSITPSPYLSYIHVLEGRAEIQLSQGKKFQLQQNEVIILEPGHEIKGQISEFCHLINLQIRVEDFEALMFRWFGYQRQHVAFISRPDRNNEQVKAGIQTIHSLLNYIKQFESFLDAPLAMMSLEEALFMTLLFSFQKREALSYNKTNNAKNVALVESYILNHLNETLNNQKLADLAGCSISQLIRAFKHKYGCTPLSFVHKTRLSMSRKLLKDKNLNYSVSHIASLCGFNHLGRFAQEYKKVFGETPSETIKERTKSG